MPYNFYKKIKCENRNNKAFMVDPEIQFNTFLKLFLHNDLEFVYLVSCYIYRLGLQYYALGFNIWDIECECGWFLIMTWLTF